MSRITITRRHTGRYYVGLSLEDFSALYGLLLLAEGAESIFRLQAGDRPTRARKRVMAAFKSYVGEVKKAAAK